MTTTRPTPPIGKELTPNTTSRINETKTGHGLVNGRLGIPVQQTVYLEETAEVSITYTVPVSGTKLKGTNGQQVATYTQEVINQLGIRPSPVAVDPGWAGQYLPEGATSSTDPVKAQINFEVEPGRTLDMTSLPSNSAFRFIIQPEFSAENPGPDYRPCYGNIEVGPISVSSSHITLSLSNNACNGPYITQMMGFQVGAGEVNELTTAGPNVDYSLSTPVTPNWRGDDLAVFNYTAALAEVETRIQPSSASGYPFPGPGDAGPITVDEVYGYLQYTYKVTLPVPDPYFGTVGSETKVYYSDQLGNPLSGGPPALVDQRERAYWNTPFQVGMKLTYPTNSYLTGIPSAPGGRFDRNAGVPGSVNVDERTPITQNEDFFYPDLYNQPLGGFGDGEIFDNVDGSFIRTSTKEVGLRVWYYVTQDPFAGPYGTSTPEYILDYFGIWVEYTPPATGPLLKDTAGRAVLPFKVKLTNLFINPQGGGGSS